MPSVNVAMERSLREGAMDLLAASLRPVLDRRAGTIVNQVNDVRTAFSSWDNCMNAVYCKWPVIALIIVGGLMILSIIWCIARCACCGLSCCCECCYCLKCCGNCCGMCDTPKGTPHKHLDDSYHEASNLPYRSQAPMTTSAVPLAPAAHAKPGGAGFSAHEPPQYAEFDVSKKGGAAAGGANEDALPAMPSWEASGSKKVMLAEEVELEQMKKPEPAAAASSSAQNLPLMTGVIPGPASPRSPGHQQDPFAAQDIRQPTLPYIAGAPAAASDPYAVGHGPGYNGNASYNNINGGYGQQSSVSLDQGYGAAAAGMAMGGQGRHTPGNSNRGYGGPGPQSRQGSYDSYGRNASQRGQGYGPPRGGPNMMGGAPYAEGQPRRSPAPYGPDGQPRRSPAPQGEYGYGEQQQPRRSPAPHAEYDYGGGYGASNNNQNPYGQPQRQYSSESTRPLAARAPPQRQYSSGNNMAPDSPPLQNTGGFDFNSGYSRPNQPQQQQSYDDDYRRPSQPSRQNTGAGGGGGYPGFKPYQPGNSNPQAQQGWSGL